MTYRRFLAYALYHRWYQHRPLSDIRYCYNRTSCLRTIAPLVPHSIAPLATSDASKRYLILLKNAALDFPLSYLPTFCAMYLDNKISEVMIPRGSIQSDNFLQVGSPRGTPTIPSNVMRLNWPNMLWLAFKGVVLQYGGHLRTTHKLHITLTEEAKKASR